MTYIKNKYEI